MKQLTRVAILILYLYSSAILAFQDTTQLLEPTGPYKVGTVLYEWADPKRDIVLENGLSEKRTIMAQFWYPAKSDTVYFPASYTVASDLFTDVRPHSYLRAGFHPAVQDSRIVIISPGRGTRLYFYTTLAEELASHGFTVVSVGMPEIGNVRYKDGYAIRPSREYRPPPGMMGGPYEKVDQFFETPTAIGVQDLWLSLSHISELNQSDPNHRFTGKLNLENIGLLGHSLGGRIAGQFAADNEDVRAYASMEGIPPRDVRYNGKIKIPQLMLCSSGTWPYAKENYFTLIENRNAPVYMVQLQGFGHNSITDGPLIRPENYQQEIDAAKGLIILREIIKGYFDGRLKDGRETGKILSGFEQINYTIYD